MPAEEKVDYQGGCEKDINTQKFKDIRYAPVMANPGLLGLNLASQKVENEIHRVYTHFTEQARDFNYDQAIANALATFKV